MKCNGVKQLAFHFIAKRGACYEKKMFERVLFPEDGRRELINVY